VGLVLATAVFFSALRAQIMTPAMIYPCMSNGFIPLPTNLSKEQYCSRNTSAIIPCDYLRCVWHAHFNQYLPLAFRCPDNRVCDSDCSGEACANFMYVLGSNNCQRVLPANTTMCYSVNLTATAYYSGRY